MDKIDELREVLTYIKEYFEENHKGKLEPEWLEFHEYRMVCSALDNSNSTGVLLTYGTQNPTS